MGIKDVQNTFSDPAAGDKPTAIGDTDSARYINQGIAGLNFFAPAGGNYVAPWILVRVSAAFTTGAAGTIAAVLQDAPDATPTVAASGGPGAYADAIVGAATTAANASQGVILLAQRLLPSMRQYLKVVYRIATGAMTAGTCDSFLALDTEVVDISMRAVGAYVNQAGQLSMAQAQGLLDQ